MTSAIPVEVAKAAETMNAFIDRYDGSLPSADVVDACATVEDYLGKSDSASIRQFITKEAPPPMSSIPYMTEREQLDQRQAELYNEEVKRLDAAHALLPEAERRKLTRESESQIKNRLMLQGGECKANASRISQLTKAGFGKVAKAEEPAAFSQGTVSDLVAAEVEKRAVALLKSDPMLKTIDRARAKVWQTDRHLWERSVANRGSV